MIYILAPLCKSFQIFFNSVYVHVCVCVQRSEDNLRGQLSPSGMWVLGMEPMESGLVVNTFTK